MATNKQTALSAATTREERVSAATAAFIAAERDDKRRGIACHAFAAVADAYKADGLTLNDACDAIAVDVEHRTDGRIKSPKPATIKQHVSTWAAVVEHYAGRDPQTVAGAAYVARTSNRAGGAKAVAAILASSKSAADVVAALDAMPRADKKDAAPAADKPLNADDVAAYLDRVAAQTWEGDDKKIIAAAVVRLAEALKGNK